MEKSLRLEIEQANERLRIQKQEAEELLRLSEQKAEEKLNFEREKLRVEILKLEAKASDNQPVLKDESKEELLEGKDESQFLSEEDRILLWQKGQNPEQNLESQGFLTTEPLEIEKIIRGCFSNPDRTKFPDFMKKKGWPISLYDGNENADDWIKKLTPKLITNFDQAKILLHDTTRLTDRSTDEKPYIEQIRNTRWSGPYKWQGINQCIFVSINPSGKNEYYVCLWLISNSDDYPSAHFYYLNKSHIATLHSF